MACLALIYHSGQIQATSTAAPVSQISDGQIQATTAAAAATTSAVAVVSQISDGQIQATPGANATVTTATTASPSQFTGAANAMTVGSAFAAVIAGVAAAVAL